MCSHGKYVMMKVIDGYKLKLMNSLAYPLVLLSYLLILSGMCSKHLENSIDATEEN